MGALLAWLRMCPAATVAKHKALYNSASLSHDVRASARTWGQDIGSLSSCFAKERPRRVGEGDEPEALA